ncbi:hypothetical protein HaLaN_13537 [Haematococcus lacustris]|uniref:Uncharacterized protein n=1 Tax=Haematococcus lacustris TaxID=44745 RepID=A0A699ZCR3_HAELA|nr:hypothetical protein HaLaN_13537 [Haematococcus lacustris]
MYLPKPMALQFGLHKCGADKAELLVVLAQRAEPGQAVERLLVLEVRPLSEAAASADQATPAPSSVALLLVLRGGAGPSQPAAAPAPASGETVEGPTTSQTVESGAVLPSTLDEEGGLGPGFRTGMKRKAADADADADQSPEAGQAAAAATSDQGPEEMDVAPAALPEASAPAAGGPDALAHVLLGCLNAGQGRGTREAPIELSDDTGDEADAGVLPDLLPGCLQVAHA